MKYFVRLFLFSMLLLVLIPLSGCQEKAVESDLVSYVSEAQQVVKNTDWDQMETVTVELSEFAFIPRSLRFKKNQPYKLQIKNVGTEKHYFTSEKFFQAVATRKVQSNADGEIKAPYFSALEVFPGRQLDFYFVPMKSGTYSDLLCTIEGHKERGMFGEIIIE